MTISQLKRHNKLFLVLLLLGLTLGALPTVVGAQESDARSPYRVVWDSPSQDWGGTMPLGNGEVAINAWFDANARAHILIARTDSWDDYGHLAKVGLAEIDMLGDAPAAELTTPFRQELDVETGVITVAYGPKGSQTRAKLWVDAKRPDVVLEIESDLEFESRAALKPWRVGEGETLTAPMVSDLWHTRDNSERAVIQNDQFLTSSSLQTQNRVVCYHRNIKTKYYDEIAHAQGLDEFPGFIPDPYVDRTFGLLLRGADARWQDEATLFAAKGRARSRFFAIAAHTAQTKTLDEWREQIERIVDEAADFPINTRRDETTQYWRDFAERSWIRFSPNAAAVKDLSDAERDAVGDDTFVVTQGYALQRFLNACQGRGNYPIKFNGGLFTHAHPDRPGSHDFRQWGPGYWWQNTRLPYYTMLHSGDFDLMETLFRRYCALVPICEYRAKKYLDVDGAYFPECIYMNGAVFPETYGLQPWNERDDKLQASGWHKREWVGGLELAFLAIRYYEFTQDEDFLKEEAIPTANAILKFFDSYYKTDPNTGKLKMTPSQALETWWDCDDPAPEIAGIRAVSQRLLAIPEKLTALEDREFWSALLAKTPELPVRHDEKSGLDALAAAARFENKRNVETPELYSVFPFRLYSFEKPGAELARNAYRLRLDRYSVGWAQDDVNCAYLGDAEGARENLVVRARNGAKSERFPAFWGPNFDWIPDQDNGGILNTAAQSLALQTDGDQIFVAPALPKTWNVEFKLWAPKQTCVQGAIVDGKVDSLTVEPKDREKDVSVCLPESTK